MDTLKMLGLLGNEKNKKNYNIPSEFEEFVKTYEHEKKEKQHKTFLVKTKIIIAKLRNKSL